MKRLCLLRHAKSDWSDTALDDAARPLNKRGRKAADFMADFIVKRGFKPDQILCSTAKRARHTCDPLTEKLGPCVSYLDELYMAMPEDHLAVIHHADKDAKTLLVIAHNPGLELLAALLAENADEAARFEHFPTGALAVFDFDTDSWADIAPAKGKLVFYGKPRELMAEEDTR